MIDPQFNIDLQALADKYQLVITGKATPVSPDEDDFDITANPATPPTPPTTNS
jgi:hypothetical protein